MKARHEKDVRKLLDIPNIGPAMVRDFHMLGITSPSQLKNNDPYTLYMKLCDITGVRQDPCVLDTYIAAVDFMNGAPSRKWFWYTKERKKKYNV